MNPFDMSPFEELDPGLQAIVNEQHRFDLQRARQVQARMNRRTSMKQMDGQYSLMRLLDGMRNNSVATTAPYEQACSERIAERLGIPARPGFQYIPIDGRRDVSVATAPQLVDTEVGSLFIDYFDSFFPFSSLGVRRLTLPRPANFAGVSTNIVTYTLANEAATLTESTPAFRTAASTPKTLGAYCELSHTFLKSSSVLAQHFLMQMLAKGVANELSRQVLVGDGSAGQATGIFSGASVNVVSAGSANLAKLMSLVNVCEAANGVLVPGSAAFVATPTISQLLRTRENSVGSGMIQVRDMAAGFPVVTTTATSPNCLAFGDFSQLLLITYDALQIATDPYGVNSSLFVKGIVGVKAWLMCDVVILNGPSFAYSGSLN